MPSFSCPKCKKVLKTSTPIPAGKKVKCPACTNLFVMPEVKEQAAIRATKPVAPPKPAPMPAAADRTKPRRPDDEEEAARQSARKAKARKDEEPDEDEEEEERPKRRKKKKREPEGNKNLILILSGAGALVLILVVVLFIWPGLLVGGDGGKVAAKGIPTGVRPNVVAALDPFALVPNNAEVVIGVNFAEALKNADETRQLDQIMRLLAATPTQLELINNMERGIFSGADLGPGIKSGIKAVLVVTSLAPLNTAKVTEAFNARPQPAKGKNLYRLLGTGFLALPDNKTVVISTLGQTELEKLLEGKGKLPADMQAHVDAISDKAVWGVLKLSTLLQDNFREKEQEINELAAQTGGADAVPAIKNAKFARFSVDGAKDAQIKVEVECANDNHAVKLEAYAKALWEGQGRLLLGSLPSLLGNQPGAKGLKMLIDEITKNFQIQRQGGIVSASLTVSESSRKELANLNLADFSAGFNPGVNPPQVKAPVESPKPSVPMPDVVAPKQGATLPFFDSLVAAPLPEGYQAITQDVAGVQVGKGGKFGKVGQPGKSLGKLILVSKPNQASKVIIQIDARDLTAIPARRAAAKAYVNVLASNLAQEGYRLVDNTIPNLDIETFENPISVKIAFARVNGTKLWTHQEIFFTNVGYVVQVIADDEQTLTNLTAWAKTVKPKT